MTKMMPMMNEATTPQCWGMHRFSLLSKVKTVVNLDLAHIFAIAVARFVFAVTATAFRAGTHNPRHDCENAAYKETHDHQHHPHSLAAAFWLARRHYDCLFLVAPKSVAPRTPM